MAGQVVHCKGILPLKQMGLESLQLGKELHQPRGCFFLQLCARKGHLCVVGTGDIKITNYFGRCS